MSNNLEHIAGLITDRKFDDASTALVDLNVSDEGVQLEKLHLEGQLLAGQGCWTEAVAKLREVLDIDHDHSEALFRLAYILDLHGEDDEAIELYERCVKEPPTHVNALLNLAILYEDHGRYDDAHMLVSSVVDQCPNHFRARIFLKDIESSQTMFYDEDREATRVKHDAILDTPVSDFELSVRSRNCLKQMEIHTLGDLLRITEPKLLAYKNFGETSLNEIKAMLAQKGLELGQSLEEHKPIPLAGAAPSGTMAAGDPNLLNRNVAEMELSVRSRKCLQRLGIASLGELTQRSEPELLSIKNFGQTSLNEIKRRLTELGLTLRDASR